MPASEYGTSDQYKTTPPPRDEVTHVIEGIRGIHEEQRVQLAERDNMIELLRDENIAMREERDFYLRKSVALAQQMKSISQLCEEGRRLAEAADKLEREASLKG
ncbi:MAG: hypothetical protein ABWY82_00725 [Tardiphaga sp.]